MLYTEEKCIRRTFREKERERSSTIQEESTKANGRKTKGMVKVLKGMNLAMCTEEPFRTTFSMDMESMSGRMGTSMMGSGKMEKRMGLASGREETVISAMENGRKGRQVAKGR